jgi:hypothetical protein
MTLYIKRLYAIGKLFRQLQTKVVLNKEKISTIINSGVTGNFVYLKTVV